MILQAEITGVIEFELQDPHPAQFSIASRLAANGFSLIRNDLAAPYVMIRHHIPNQSRNHSRGCGPSRHKVHLIQQTAVERMDWKNP